MNPMNDVFISYRHCDADQVRRVKAALERVGLGIWIDESGIEDFESIQQRVENGLAKSKVLLAWYSSSYPESRPCQWEFTTALTTALAARQALERILVVNPEGTPEHIYPELFRDQKYLIPGSTEIGAIVDAVNKRVRSVSGDFTSVCAQRGLWSTPQWYGRYGASAPYFVGRLREMWRIHSALHADQYPMIHARTPLPLVQVVGLGGMGKSLLVEEYALRFGSQYPSGVFWLNAGGDAKEQVATFARQFGVDIRKSLIGARQPYLWVVDDVPEHADESTWNTWLPPENVLARTVITTRSRQFEGRGEQLILDELPKADAVSLLVRKIKPDGESEQAAAEGICEDLGYQPLALDVASRAIATFPERPRYAKYWELLNQVNRDELEFAASLKGQLPNGHEKSIAATLMTSIRNLTADGYRLLRLAGELATAPISLRLAVDTFAAIPATAQNAGELVRGGLNELEDTALARLAAEAETFQVHALVRRTVRFEAKNGRLELCRGAAATLIEILRQTDYRKRTHLDDNLEHARVVMLSIVDRMQELDVQGTRLLVGLLQQLSRWGNRLYLDYPRASALLEKIATQSRAKLGDDEHTLFVMNDLAVLHYAHDHRAAAREWQEKVLDLSSRIRGEEHVDTFIAMRNLMDTLQMQHDAVAVNALLERMRKTEPRVTGTQTLNHNPP